MIALHDDLYFCYLDLDPMKLYTDSYTDRASWEHYAHPELHLERNPLPRVHAGVTGPTDWNEALDIVAYGAPEQDWITEMAPYLKSIDTTHLLEIELEGFCGDDRKQYNPNNIQAGGTHFITNNQVPSIDFATVHCYPDQWLSGKLAKHNSPSISSGCNNIFWTH
ncbi:hypothetical protein BVRB_7g168280 [Beta vulgaris subsp. vulgaris]|uniref:Asl1-like glycosyl hydrolase catalytic domain-containing protein n=1 Tax=Beta vulgaris subsp. vulgaris TaxID=3555 RepID=A0A0J8BVG3_BETVV|nr:hypothetical protein BVRB_7g168280 [Beta vulgaris subsp. vulgaris]